MLCIEYICMIYIFYVNPVHVAAVVSLKSGELSFTLNGCQTQGTYSVLFLKLLCLNLDRLGEET